MKKLSATVFLFFLFASGFAQNKEKDSRMEWWRNARFGMFIHWGLYAVPAGEYNGNTSHGEWIMNTAKISIPEYEKYASQFNPQQFNADAWVLMAKNAGMKYIVITSKHHDGFCMWDSKVTDYDVLDRTPFKRDIMKELSDACKKYGIIFCMYHSIMDWHHPDENKTSIAKYREEYLKPELKELITKYDPAVLWFDGEWVDEWTTGQGDSLYNWLLQLKPNLIINNRVSKGRNGMQGMSNKKAAGDFGTPEQEILSEKSTEDWESCMTMNDHWGYNKNDQNWKTTNQLVWNLVDIVAKGGNYLLNVGPTAQGLFPDSSIQRLKEIGDWMKVNSEAVYGMQTWQYYDEGSDIRYAKNKKGEVYVYLNDWPGKEVLLKKIKPVTGTTIQLVGTNEQLLWKQTTEGIVVSIPSSLHNENRHSTANVYVLKLKATPQILAAAPQIGTDDEAKTKTKVIAGGESLVSITSNEKNAIIHFTVDGSTPSSLSPVYKGPVPVSQSGFIKATAYIAGKMPSETSELKIVKGKYAIILNSSYATQYAAMGPVSLVDGLYGDARKYHKDWLGFEGKNLEAVLDLGYEKSFSSISCSFLKNHGEWIFLPVRFSVFTSADGSNFQLLGELTEPVPQQQEDAGRKLITVNIQAKARYIKIVAETIGHCPAWHAGNGGKAWVFADEIEVK